MLGLIALQRERNNHTEAKLISHDCSSIYGCSMQGSRKQNKGPELGPELPFFGPYAGTRAIGKQGSKRAQREHLFSHNISRKEPSEYKRCREARRGALSRIEGD
eukprot:1161650-Pelagomonas_calceolata.AAC.2